MVAKLEWGRRRVCPPCGARFYDLQRSPIICPKCGEEFDPESLLKRRTKKGVEVPAAFEEGLDLDGGEPAAASEEADVLENTSDDLSDESVEEVVLAKESSFEEEEG
ncbi:MAG: TIGR02300 family protein [Holosporales bacterium]|jgi:uncharacterized protein (TIGR02300 family)|nr:TIGR02300 family protein [Holosporales bacterium]